MKFTVHTFDVKENKSNDSYIGKFEIYDSNGEFVHSSGRRRFKGFDPSKKNSVPLAVIARKVGDNIKLKVVRVDTDHRPRLDVTPEAIYEIICEENIPA